MQRRNMIFKMNVKRYIPDHAITTVPALLLLFTVFYYFSSDETVDGGIETTANMPLFTSHWQSQNDSSSFDIDAELTRLQLDDSSKDADIRQLLHEGEYQSARTLLLEIAADAVQKQNQTRLANTLLLLGEVAIHQQELSAAEIYLQESLHLTIEQDNVLGTARCYQLLGQLNIRARELARRAADTYDTLWQARNAISRGFYQGVDENLQQVIDENLSIRRYGAAADAYEARAAFYDRLHDGYQAESARIEAAKLFASTGQVTHVRRLLDGLDQSQITDDDRQQVESEVDQILQRYRQDRAQTTQAHDYQTLYHHYQRQGDVERAWKFRIKSSQTLANTSDRALFQRQADVIAVLYNSNFAMDRAKNYLDQAGEIYSDLGVNQKLLQTRGMENEIY